MNEKQKVCLDLVDCPTQVAFFSFGVMLIELAVATPARGVAKCLRPPQGQEKETPSPIKDHPRNGLLAGKCGPWKKNDCKNSIFTCMTTYQKWIL